MFKPLGFQKNLFVHLQALVTNVCSLSFWLKVIMRTIFDKPTYIIIITITIKHIYAWDYF